jgi:hypothetical protein
MTTQALWPRSPLTGSQADPVVLTLYPSRKAGCWLLIGPPQHKRTCRLPVYRDGLCRWHTAFAAKEMA